MNLAECPDCRVTLEDRDTEIWCWRCGQTIVHANDNTIGYMDRADAIREANR